MSRLAYGWSNPNHAAAFLVTLIPLLWGAQSDWRTTKSFWRGAAGVAIAAELVLTTMMALTYSRGAIVAYVAALPFFAIVCRGERAVRFTLTRIGLIVVLAGAVGLGRRFSLVLNGDASSEHRLELWLGGLQLIDARPWFGWGRGMSGQMYMQWIQPLSRTELHGGMVNSYLHLAVEFGLPTLWFALFLLLLPVCLSAATAQTLPIRERHLSVGAGAGVVAFAVANIFTTLWVFVTVDAAFFAAAVLAAGIGLFRAGGSAFKSPCRRAAAVAVAIVAIVAVSAWIANSHANWSVRALPAGGVQLVRRHEVPRPTDPVFLVDRLTLGPYYGKALRFDPSTSSAQFGSFTVFPPGATPAHLRSPVVFVLGARAGDHLPLMPDSSVFVIHPSVAVPTTVEWKPTLIVVPTYDEIGYARAWREWSRSHAFPVVTSAETGQQANADWDGIVRTCLAKVHP